MTDRHQQKPYPLRMPEGLRELLEFSATSGNRSLHSEIVARLTRSFDAAGDSAQLQSEVQRLQELVEAQRKALSAQDVTAIVLATYLVDVINALPRKLRSEDRIKAAAQFVLGLGDDVEAQQGMLQLDTPVATETVKATVRGKVVDTGIRAATGHKKS
jgi:hypothetical protein